MPIDDFISGLAELGGSGKGWRSWTAILGIVVGLLLGAYLGWQASGLVGALGGAPLGAFIGWGAGVLLRGLVFFLVFFVVALALVLGWEILTGGAT